MKKVHEEVEKVEEKMNYIRCRFVRVHQVILGYVCDICSLQEPIWAGYADTVIKASDETVSQTETIVTT